MPRWLPLLLGFLTALNPLSTDMYLPAFPAIEAEFGGASGGASATLAAWFLGLAIGQMTQGTLSDRFGRRGPLIVGTLVYTAASVGCALAWDTASLSAFRALAAFGGSASAVIPRAVVRDVADGLAAARVMSRLILVMGAAPILAPSLGGLLLGVASWRAIFWLLAGYGVLSCLLVWRFLPDTLPPERRVRQGAWALLRGFGRVATERGFIVHALMGASAMICMFAYISGAPGVFIERYGMSPATFAVAFSTTAVGFIGGAQFNPWLAGRFGSGRVMRGASALVLAAAVVLAVAVASGVGGPWGILGPIFVLMIGCSLLMPNAGVAALSRHGHRAGTASSLMGSLQFGVAGITALLVGEASDGTAWPLAAGVLIGATLLFLLDRLRR